MMKATQYGGVCLKIFDTRAEMGAAAAEEAAACIKSLLAQHEEINCVFAAAPSQNDFLAALRADGSIPWERINAYHMDEYVGLKMGGPNSFSGFLKDAIFDRVPFRSVHLINGENAPEAEAERYGNALRDITIHITFMGIGENGHIAFNDPSVADFNDPALVKVVELEESCRMQQVHDGCFPRLEDVPRRAMTLTCPTLLSSEHIFCIVPTEKKRQATIAALTGEISEACPASVLRRKDGAKMYIDRDCAGELAEEKSSARA